MDDIWASLYYQAKGHTVVFDRATVYQERNDHNITTDFENEIKGYINTVDLIDELKNNPDNIEKYIPPLSWLAFKEYRRIITEGE